MAVVDEPAILHNRFLQKKLFERAGVPTPHYRLARNHRELVVSHKALGFPGVIKLQYDDGTGDGPWVVRDFDDPPRVLQATKGRPLLWERYVDVDAAFVLQVARTADGHVDAIGDVAEPGARAAAVALATRVANALPPDVDRFAMRFFVCGGIVAADTLAEPAAAAVTPVPLTASAR
jgi:phosphoribosylaminoimidazole carboxylase (NCAIR synthetase)